MVMSIPLYYADGTGKDEDILVRDPCSMPVFMSSSWLNEATTRQVYLSKNSSVGIERERRQFALLVAKELTAAKYRPAELYPHAVFSSVDRTTVYFGPWTPGDERLALITNESPNHPTFIVKVIYDDDRSRCLFRLATPEATLVTELDPTASGEASWTLDHDWRDVIKIGTLGDVSAKMGKLWPKSIYCLLSLTPSADSRSPEREL